MKTILFDLWLINRHMYQIRFNHNLSKPSVFMVLIVITIWLEVQDSAALL